MSQKGGRNSTHKSVPIFWREIVPMPCPVQSKKGAPCGKAEQAERRAQRVMLHCLITGDAGGAGLQPVSLSSFLNTPFSSLILQSAIFKLCEGQWLY